MTTQANHSETNWLAIAGIIAAVLAAIMLGALFLGFVMMPRGTTTIIQHPGPPPAPVWAGGAPMPPPAPPAAPAAAMKTYSSDLSVSNDRGATVRRRFTVSGPAGPGFEASEGSAEARAKAWRWEDDQAQKKTEAWARKPSPRSVVYVEKSVYWYPPPGVYAVPVWGCYRPHPGWFFYVY